MQLWSRGREEEEAHIGRQAEAAGLVKGAIIKDEEMEVVRGGGSQLLQEELEEGAGERGEFQKEALARRRFHGPIQIQTLEPIGGRDRGLQAPGGDPATHDRQ